MEELNRLEKSILNRLSKKYPSLIFHIPYLKVQSRELTGVGMYINLLYSNSIDQELDLDIKNTSISTNEIIELDGLKYGLCFELDISDGKLNFIELVTIGEEWDGNVSDNFVFK